MTDLKSMTLEEMEVLLKGWGEPSFRAGQVFYLAAQRRCVL